MPLVHKALAIATLENQQNDGFMRTATLLFVIAFVLYLFEFFLIGWFTIFAFCSVLHLGPFFPSLLLTTPSCHPTPLTASDCYVLSVGLFVLHSHEASNRIVSLLGLSTIHDCHKQDSAGHSQIQV